MNQLPTVNPVVKILGFPLFENDYWVIQVIKDRFNRTRLMVTCKYKCLVEYPYPTNFTSWTNVRWTYPESIPGYIKLLVARIYMPRAKTKWSTWPDIIKTWGE